ncbi:MAG: SDR family oxidoreductase, partial [Actinobacteria bacterium]|nr:SDR family oxidoreductase [Actinomycetota bacterium]
QLGSSLPYAVSKAALNHMTRLLAKALGGTGVRVNAVAPGLITTPWTADWDDMHVAVAAGAPLRRVGTPEDVADACVLLADSTYTTGEVLVVDGGLGLLM